MTDRKLKIGLILDGVGLGFARWRHPGMPVDACVNLEFNVRQTLTAERGKFDYVFIADGVYADAKSMPKMLNHLEPMVTLGALSVLTRHIGLVATVSVTYSEPYNVARQLATLDKISNGRAGWNVVTTASEGAAGNFGKPAHMEHDLRYKLAGEFMEVVKGLWDSFEDGAIIGNKEAGVFLDSKKLHPLEHKGEFFEVRGALNIERTPQAHPVAFQAGTSEAGRDFAAEYGEALFIMPSAMEDAKSFIVDVKGRAAKYGRKPQEILVLPGINPIVAETSEDARDLEIERARLAPIDSHVKFLNDYFNHYDFLQHAVDDPFPNQLPESAFNAYRGKAMEIAETARRESLTLREVALRYGTPSSGFTGTAAQVADTMQAWFEADAADGFMIFESLPGQLDAFVDQVVPILQARDLFREHYESETLRGNFGLATPPNRYTAATTKRPASLVDISA